MYRRSLVVAVLLGAFFSAGTVFADEAATTVWELRYAKNTTETRTKDATEHPSTDSPEFHEPEESSSDMTVRLEPARLAIRESATETIYDFEEKSIVRIDHEAKTLIQASLFSDVGFRDAEFQNRIMLGEVLGKAGIEDNPFDQTQLKVLFSMDKGEAGDPVETLEEGASLRFSVGDVEITSYVPDERKCPEALRASLRRFLVYCCSMHPAVRSRIVDDGHVPESLEFRYQALPSIFEVDLSLQGVESGAAPISVPADFKRSTEGRPLQQLLESIATTTVDDRKSDSDYLEEARTFQDSRRAVDALLTLFEMLLATGRQPVDQIREVASGNREDDQLQALLTAMRVADEDPQKALDLNLSMDRDGLEKTHVLQIFQANYQTFLGNVDEASDLFVGALQVNPYIAGVYKDLGDIHYRQYDMHTAWQCWDAARDLAPDHPMLVDIGKLEQYLESEYPDFF